MTNTTFLLLSGYVVQWVVQRMFKDVAALRLYILNKRYWFALLFCVLWNTSIGRRGGGGGVGGGGGGGGGVWRRGSTSDAQAVLKKSCFISGLNGSVLCWTGWSNLNFRKLKVNCSLLNLISDRQKKNYEITVSICGGQNRWRSFKFRVCKFVPHRTFNWIKQPDAFVS
jgi:hypothetical protein